MEPFEIACFLIVAAFLVVRARRDEDPPRFLARLFVLAVAAFVGEDSCIRLYGFYSYSPRWSLFVDQVPLAVLLIWPVVVQSSYDLARALLPEGSHRAPLLGAIFVLADASLIEPVAVDAGLWSWTVPGLFGVPPIGVLGWAFFALGATSVLERGRAPLAILIAPLVTHALLLASWWGALRWVDPARWLSAPLPWVSAAWAASLALCALVLFRGLALRVPLVDMLLRVPGALFFFVLLGIHGRDDAALVAWVLAFAPPYLALTFARRPRSVRSAP